MKPRPSVLLIEGDAADEALIREAIAKSELHCDVRVARSVAEASVTLFESAEPAPDLVLVELDIAKLNDYELLTRIRSHKSTKRVPVTILAPPGRQAEIDKAYELHVNSFVEKDLDPECLEARVKIVLYYWIAVNHNAGP